MSLLNEIYPKITAGGKVWKIGDLSLSAFLGALLVIPQAIIFSYLTGVSPEYGIYSAIFVTFFAALFGQTPMLGGPNTTVSILIGMAVIPYAGTGSPLYIEYVIILSIMVGMFQLIFWLVRGARIFDFFNPSAILGVTTGIGVILCISALDGLLGLEKNNSYLVYDKIYYLLYEFNVLTNYNALLIGLVTIISGFMAKKYSGRYYIIVAIFVGGVMGYTYDMMVPQVISNVEKLGYIPMDIAFNVPTITSEHFVVIMKLLLDALIIAFVGVTQSLIITKTLSYKLNKTYNQNKEIFAQGISNVLGGFFGGFAGSGSFNRSAINVESGAKGNVSGMVSSLLIVVIIYVLSPVLAHVPMSAISGVLFLVGVAMIKPDEIKLMLKNKYNRIIFPVVFITIVLLGLQIGIIIALLLSIILYLKGASKLIITRNDRTGKHILKIQGPLYYATLDQLRNSLVNTDTGMPIIIDLSHISEIDWESIDMIGRFIKDEVRCSVSVLVENEYIYSNIVNYNVLDDTWLFDKYNKCIPK